MDFDDVLPHIHGHGRYQLFIYYVIAIPVNFLASFVFTNFIYVSATPNHWCRVPGSDGTNMSLEGENRSLQFELENGKLISGSCEMFNVNSTWLVESLEENNTSADRHRTRSKCKYGWNYDKSMFDTTLVTEMNVVCDYKHLPVIANTGFGVGNTIGSLIFGHFSDKYGRKSSLLFMIAMTVIVGIMACFPPNYISYIVYRSIMGVNCLYGVSVVLALELMMPDKREMYGSIFAVLYSIGLIAFSGLAYALRDWFYISSVSSFPFIALIAYWWIIPESPRWLLSQNRIAEAEAIVQKIAKANGVIIKENFLSLHFQAQNERGSKNQVSEPVVKSPYLELIKHKNMRTRMILMTFDMIVISVMYNALIFGSSLMELNIYLSSAVLSFSEIPGIALAWVIAVKMGRRWAMFLCLGLGGIACFCIIFVPLDYVLTIFILSNVGKAGVSGAYGMIFIYGSELFPTPLRSSALLIANLFASIVAIGVPYFLLLADYYRTLPFIIIGAMSVAGSLAVMYLPETRNIHLPQTIEEGEVLGAEDKCCHFNVCKKMNTAVQ